MPTRLLVALALAFPLFTLAAPPPQQADVTVSANVIASCTLGATNVNFGDYDPLEATDDDDGAATLTVRCSKGQDYVISFTGARVMTGPAGATLTFDLFSDAGRTTSWTNYSYTPDTGRAALGDDVIDVFGRIPANQDVPVGAYSTTLVASIHL